MHRKISLVTVLLIAVFCGQNLYAQMSDNAIIKYIMEGVSAGKTESQLGTELLAKGVSTQQLQRLMKSYKEGKANTLGVPTVSNRLERVGSKNTATNRGAQKKGAASREEEVPTMGGFANPIGGPEEIKDSVVVSRIRYADGSKMIYGHNFFSNGSQLSFEPNENAATPEDYILGPGDQLLVEVWGESEASYNLVVTPEGKISMSQIGSIAVSGLSIKDATTKVRSQLSKYYAGLRGSRPTSWMSLTLSEVRTIQISIAGEVNIPGTYRLSAFTTVLNALYKAGGVTSIGSLRNVKILRGGNEVSSVDVYSVLFGLSKEANTPLKEGDIIVVPPYDRMASVDGGVRRPMFYELKEGETLSDLIRFAGGFSGDADASSVNVGRTSGTRKHVYTVKSDNLSSFPIQDCDSAFVSVSNVELFENMVQVDGSVYRPGAFELGGSIATVKQLVEHAGGLMADAFLARAQIIREKPDRSLELLAIPIGAIMSGNAPDVMLKRNDMLFISNINDINPKGDFTITGYVLNPGKYQYAEHTTVEDLILLAGGLTEGASSVKVDVSRRINNPSSTEASDTLALIFTFSIKDGLMIEGDPGFELEPFDAVAVRKSPTFVEQKIITVSGAVNFPGQYTLESTDERVSDLIKRAGGPTNLGDIHGAMLKRKISQYERNVRMTMSRIINQNIGKDSINTRKIMVSEQYSVGLELDKALANPGSAYDMVLRDGDEVIVPEYTSTVRIQGEVLYPNTVQFIKNKPVGYYVRQAGGFSPHAKRFKTYVVHMNGTVSVGLGAVVDAGSEIVVPNKPERNKLTTGEWLGIGTSAASITTMIATIVSLFKKQ
ncbi:MAG: SLBB domain-containing protein [Bacteroidales bacterium]|nr:SLBB domain-containing protein [Bacteroidales bacterium]